MPDGTSGILRFTPNGDPVDGGLFGDIHPLDKYYAYGIRNGFGLDYDPITGNIWMADNGPTCCDEINIVRQVLTEAGGKSWVCLLIRKQSI